MVHGQSFRESHFDLTEVMLDARLAQHLVEVCKSGIVAGRPIDRKHDEYSGRDKICDKVGDTRAETAWRLADQKHYQGRLILGQQLADLIVAHDVEQNAAFVRPPIIAEEGEVAPPAVVLAADRIPCLVDRAPAARAQMLAPNVRPLLELAGV